MCSTVPTGRRSQTERCRMKVLMGVALLLGALLAACAKNTPPSATHTITGQVIDSDSSVAFSRQDGRACTDRYMGPIYPAGTVVKVIGYKGNTRTHATGRLSEGTSADGGHECQWTFTVRNVRDAGAYLVEVVNGPGGSFLEADMERMNWNVTLGASASSG